MNYRDPSRKNSAHQEAVSMTPRELEFCVATLAYEQYEDSRGIDRDTLARFFGLAKPATSRLVRAGLLVAEGRPERLKTTAKLRRRLGVDECVIEERKAG